jgi:integrase
MAVGRDSRGRWRYRKQITLPDGRTIRISGTPVLNTKLEAEKAERAHIQRELEPPPPGEEPKQKEVPTFDTFADEFMATYAKTNNRPSECAAKHKILRHHLRPAFGSRKLDDITVRDVEQLKAELLKRLGRKTINNILAVLGKLLRYGRDVGVVEKVPTIKLLKLAPSKFDFLTFEDYDALTKAARVEPEWCMAIMVAGDAGLRMGEILALQWDDIDFRNGTITVLRNNWMGMVGPPKGGRARTVPLTDRLAHALKKDRHLRGHLVFCREGGEAWTRNVMKAGLRRALRRAGLRQFGWHVLRHTFCSHLAMRGAVPKAVQELAGHTTLNVTLRYMHLAPGALHDAIRLLNRAEVANQ